MLLGLLIGAKCMMMKNMYLLKHVNIKGVNCMMMVKCVLIHSKIIV